MTYKLDFKKSALKEWKKLGSTLQQQFKKKLIERLDNPHVPASKLSGADSMYKIKLRQSGYRLVYKVEDDVIIVTVLAVGKRERSDVYRNAMKRLDDWLRYNAALCDFFTAYLAALNRTNLRSLSSIKNFTHSSHMLVYEVGPCGYWTYRLLCWLGDCCLRQKDGRDLKFDAQRRCNVGWKHRDKLIIDVIVVC